jgi:hypothetical protein
MAKRNSKASRSDGRTYQDDGYDDVLVANDDDENFGIVMPAAIAGLAKVGVDDLIGPVVGGLGTVASTLVIRRYGAKLPEIVRQNAQLFGGLGGILLSLPLMYWKGRKAMVSGVVTAGVFALGGYLMEKVETSGLYLSGLGGRGGMGYLAAQPVGMLPKVTESTQVPRGVNRQVDIGAYGRAF